MKSVICATAGLLLIGQVLVAPSSASALSSEAAGAATTTCAGDTRAALARARIAVGGTDDTERRIGMDCLIDAIAALDDKVQGLSDGSLPFEGQVYIPKGWIIAKPSASGAD